MGTTDVEAKVEEWKGELKDAANSRVNPFRYFTQSKSGGRKTRRNRQQKKRKTARRKSKQANI